MSDRREFLQQAALLLAGLSCRPGSKPAEPGDAGSAQPPPHPPEAPRALLPEQRRTFEAATWRILPSDHEPGAKEAGVIEYIDRELARPEFADLKKTMLAGLVALDRFADRLGGNKSFADLAPAEQDEIIAQVQKASDRGRDFVRLLVYMTIEGFVGDPMYGGNKNGVGWKLIGYGPGNPDGSGSNEGGHAGAHH